MDEIQKQLLDLSTNAEVALFEWLIDLAFLIAIVSAIKWVYINRSSTVSNKKLYANNFLAFALAIFLIVTSIKTSLALSLGLVGALSIVRFRTAIKEPEQLVYLFIIIGVAISLAAQQIIPCLIITIVFLTWSFTSKPSNSYINKDLVNILFEYENNEAIENIFQKLKTMSVVNGFEKIKTNDHSMDMILSISSMEDADFLNLKKSLAEITGVKNVNISFISSLSF